MTPIKIDPAKGKITVGIQAKSLIVISFSITVYKPDGDTIDDRFTGDTGINNPSLVTLPKDAAYYIDFYLGFTLKFMDPAADGTIQYTLDLFLSQQDVKVDPVITLTGPLKPGENSEQTSYHIQ
ncbi:hypothetical protein FO440_14270 [Mucilaginibacter corticis]|uniref:Uncharacterized protein n=1 Tax=Mucilaginibacter corticis TaxID=2597670 RepID=A0A556MLV4_9SPHI|nr:hypothetical protein [Mucilaginibacter corticis]TSJ40900.1 hypothetical protein FO440_14270 [Mucilaginibacter corticis]